jgi:hypothetical protein
MGNLASLANAEPTAAARWAATAVGAVGAEG